MNNTKIATNKAARGAPASTYRDQGSRGRVGRGGGRESAGRGRCGRWPGQPANYESRGKFGQPAHHKRVRVVDIKAFAACKTYGWNDGARCHITGAHDIYLERGCVMSASLEEVISTALVVGGGRGSVVGRGSDGYTGNGGVLTITTIMAKCSTIENNHTDPGVFKMARTFAALMKALGKV